MKITNNSQPATQPDAPTVEPEVIPETRPVEPDRREAPFSPPPHITPSTTPSPKGML